MVDRKYRMLDMSNEDRLQYLFKYRTFDIAEVLLDTYHQHMRALYIDWLWIVCMSIALCFGIYFVFIFLWK